MLSTGHFKIKLTGRNRPNADDRAPRKIDIALVEYPVAGCYLYKPMSFIMSTIADVFIIESLDPDDEGNGRFEGVFLSHVLRLHGKAPMYRYVRTREEFGVALQNFAESQYRYLHISAHADSKGLVTTNQDEIDFDELGEMLEPHMKGRRLFISACKMVNEDLAKAIIPASGCNSVVGPIENIAFTDSAVVWASIYHLAFSEDLERITRNRLREKLQLACNLFEVNFAYYARSQELKRGYTRNLLGK